MKPRAGAQNRRHLASLQAFDGLPKQGGVTVCGAYTHLSAIGAVRRVGSFAGQLRKVLPRLGASQHLLGALLKRLHSIRGGALWHGHQHLRQVQLHRGWVVGLGLLVLQVLIHLKIAHAHSGLYLALAQSREQDLLAQLFSEAFHLHAIHHHAAAQICHAELVLAGYRLLSLIHRGVVHLQAGVARQLQLGALVNELVQNGFG